MTDRPILIRGAHVLDGTGAPARPADIAVIGGRIRVDTTDLDHPQVIDAGGLVLTPGLIDVHTHSDALALQPAADPALVLAPVRQGVTTEIAGNCGSSLFPEAVGPAGRPALESFVRTLFGDIAEPLAGMPAFLASHRRIGRLTNIATLVGHSTLRAAVVGFDQRAVEPAELQQMCQLADAAMAAGAAGLSSGLIYPPGTYADTAELVALARVAARRGRPYVTHLRDEMSLVEQALAEALRIANASGAALHVSHHKTAGRRGWGRSGRTLATMDAARADGIDVTCDVYPYTAASTHLHAMFPPSLNAGGIDRLLHRLAEDPQAAETAKQAIAQGEPGWENTVGNGGWDLIEVATAPGRPAAEGHSVADLAAASGRHPVDYAAELLLAGRAQVTVISRSMAEQDVRRVLAHPGTMVGSDGVPQTGRPHPRWAGSFARVLGRYVRDEGLLALPDAIARMTSIPARRFGLPGRGVIADGAHADLMLLDPSTVADRATFADPLLPPVGIHHVLVGGVPVIRDGEPTGARPGAALAAE